MSRFASLLADRQSDSARRRWLYVPYDQLSDAIGPLAREDPSDLGIVMLENPWKASRRPYHRQKLALVLANGRHFALEQAARGVAVRCEVATGPYRETLGPLIRELGPLRMMRPAERELRVDLAPLVDSGGLIEIPHEGWLSIDDDFCASQKPSPPWRLDALYRQLRRRTGLLMENGKPEGGAYSFDAENRKPWPGEPPAPASPRFEPDEITLEVGALIEKRFAHHPGELDLAAVPATAKDAGELWKWALADCLPFFGPFEDAMTRASRGLFHTRISGLLNLHRLLPSRVVSDVAALEIPRASKEGFIRQVLGWREFVHHVHERTDGFRELADGAQPVASSPGDAGWSRWAGRPWPAEHASDEPDGGSVPTFLGADRPIPPGLWPGRPTGFGCLDQVVDDVWAEAWSHHITRLMVVANIATLLEVSPRQLADWFWVAYLDAYDWVVEPNVLAMGTFGAGPVMTTKPYVSGAAYINRMSDFCSACAFDPKKNCPITELYWAFLHRHRDSLSDNPRMRLALSSLARRKKEQVRFDRAVFEWVMSVVYEGGELRPAERPEVDGD